MSLTRESFLKPIELETITVPTRLGDVTMRELSGTQMGELRDWARPDGELDEKRASKSTLKLLTMCIVDSDGKAILSDEDFATIEAYPRKLRETLITSAARLNGLVGESAEVTEELRGKSSN